MSNIGYRPVYKFDEANLKQLNDTLRAMWGKLMGRMEIKDLSSDARAVIDSKAVGADVETRFLQTEEEIELRAKTEDVETWFRQADGRIELAAKTAETLDNGSGVVITREGVSVSGDQYVNMEAGDGSGYLNITPGGVDASSLTAPNVAVRYDGAGAITIDPAATGEQVAAGTHLRSLSDAAGLLMGKQLGEDVTLNLAAGMEEYGAVVFRGISGPGKLVVSGQAGARATLRGHMELREMNTGAEIRNMDIDMAADEAALIVSGRGSYARVEDCVINADMSGRGIQAERGAAATVRNAEVYDCAAGLYAESGGLIDAADVKGNSRVRTNGGIILATGAMTSDTTAWDPAALPDGSVISSGITVDQGSGPVVPTQPVTGAWLMEHSDTYAGSWSFYSNADIYQGYVRTANGGKTAYGCVWFPASLRSGLEGKTILQATLRLYQDSNVGRGVSVSVGLGGTETAYADRGSSAPPVTRGYGVIGTTEPGRATTLTIPVEAVQDLADGTTKGLMLLSDDAEEYKGRGYSRNYARFRGETSGDANTKAMLTVVYV